MAIKVGDIVECGGVRQRVMGIRLQEFVRLSKEPRMNWYGAHKVTLVEPYKSQDIQPGDFIRILDIPDEEQNFWDNANKPLKGDMFQVDDVTHHSMCGTLIYIRVNGRRHLFMEPYVEKISDYDII